MRIYIYKIGFFIFILSLGVVSCKKETKGVDVSHLQSNVKIVRFEQIFADANEKTFPAIKSKYKMFFPDGRTDNDWLAYKNDTIFQELYTESQKTFGNFKVQKKALESVFKHVKYYYPNFKDPEVYTIISNLDVENQVIYADSILLISLDTYLGKSKIYYADSPVYVQKNFEPQRIPIDVATAIAYKTSPEIPYRMFIERIIAYGKLKYAVQQFLPEYSEAEIMGYADEQIQWAKNNEYPMWQYFMEKEYLFNSEKDLQRRFMDVAPFSKFYIATDAESPGQIGIWLGLQIVKSYMTYNQVSLPEMLATAPIDIFNKSKYKPTK